MGRVTVTLKLTNHDDRALRRAGFLTRPVRETEVEALVDSGATLLCLKRSVIDTLGLELIDAVNVQTANGQRAAAKYGPIWLELMGRACLCSALELSEETPNLLGQIPMEELDFVIDPKRQRLIGNPAHNGVQSSEVY